MPCFVFGTGRCGSTHLQRLISLRSTTWIWGEHEGFLIDLLAAMQRFEASASLNKDIFDNPRLADENHMRQAMLDGVGNLAWMNRFSRHQLRQELTALIDRLFRQHLPEGADDWGFKEIRYGWENDVPRILLELFPSASAAFVFRPPQDTITSMVATWTPVLCRDRAYVSQLESMCRVYAERWKALMLYFLDLKSQGSQRLDFFSVDDLDSEPESLLARLGLEMRTDNAPQAPLASTNRGPKQIEDWARTVIDQCYAPAKRELEAIYDSANAIARDDRLG